MSRKEGEKEGERSGASLDRSIHVSITPSICSSLADLGEVVEAQRRWTGPSRQDVEVIERSDVRQKLDLVSYCLCVQQVRRGSGVVFVPVPFAMHPRSIVVLHFDGGKCERGCESKQEFGDREVTGVFLLMRLRI